MICLAVLLMHTSFISLCNSWLHSDHQAETSEPEFISTDALVLDNKGLALFKFYLHTDTSRRSYEIWDMSLDLCGEFCEFSSGL